MDYPKLRPLEAIPIPGERALCLRDPLGFCENPIVISEAGLLFLHFFDGQHSVRDIQTALTRAGGAIVLSDHIEAVIRQFDELHLLDSETFQRHRAEVIQRFRVEPLRQGVHAGQAYPDDAEAMRAYLDLLYRDADGAGAPPFEKNGNRVRAIMAPHIDLRNGGPCYTHAYRALAEGSEAGTFVILGVAHSGAENLFAATRKAFASPLGVLQPDHEFIDALASRVNFDLFHDEYAHCAEHSIEFQVVFLQHLFGNEVKIVPILVGGFHATTFAGKAPETDDRVASFIDAMRQTLTQYGDRAAVILSVDLAHVGMRFGDEEPLSDEFLDRVERADREFLRAAESLDAAAMLSTIRQNEDARRVDGYPGLYTLLRALPLSEGTLLRYAQAVNEEAQSAVSFASMVFR